MEAIDYMKRALALAAQATGNTSPNPLVGCVLTDSEGNIVGEGYHHKAGEAHAEVNALAEVRKGHGQVHTAYVTLEPCSHFGRTGPCCDALINAGVKRVVAALEDPNPKVAGQGLARLRAAGVQVEVGLCGKEAALQNERFLLWITKKRPFIGLKYAMTLDGKITTCLQQGGAITGVEALTYSHGLRKAYDAILVGINTVLSDDPELTCRLVQGKNPIRLVLDSRGRIPLNARVLQGGAETIIVVGPKADPVKVAALQELPQVEVITLPLRGEGLDLEALMSALAQRTITSVLVEGGSAVQGSFFEAGLVDRVYAFVAPKLIGGARALAPIGGAGLQAMEEAVPVQVDTMEKLGEDLLISGPVKIKEA